MLGWLKGKPKSEPAAPRRQNPDVDEDETIVIDLMGDQPPSTRNIRLELDPATAFGAPETRVPASVDVRPNQLAPRPAIDDDRTEVITVGSLTRSETVGELSTSPASALAAGWLCVTNGPHRGSTHPIRMGRNKVGRGPANQIVLAVGDDAISTDAHVVVAADPKTRRFFIVPGDSTNIAYVDGEPLLAAVEVVDRAKLQLGLTEIVFIQCLGNYVDWS